jgi:hypothetical protein
VSRIHRRDARGEWTLEVVHPGQRGVWGHGGGFFAQALGPPLYLVSMAVTRDEAHRLMESGSRGTVSFQAARSYAGDQMWASGIEVTVAEAGRMMLHGEHPRDVLLGPPPACGYRLRAVIDLF